MYNFHKIIQQFSNKKILVLGDAMMDTYVFGNSQRLCREAPVPIVDIQGEDNTGGGAANTAINITKLGAICSFLSVIGDDVEGKILLQMLNQHGVDTQHVLIDPKRKTLSKTRVSANGHLLLRCDSGTTDQISAALERQLISRLIDIYPHLDSVIISDYGYGILSENIIATLGKLQAIYPRLLVVDSKFLDIYAPMNPIIVKPNYQEAANLLGITKVKRIGERIQQVCEWKDRLFEKTNAQIVSVTVDKEGAITFEKNGTMYRTFTHPVENAKAAGAGDTYISAFTLSFLVSQDPSLSAELAAGAATITVEKNGTAFCSQQELLSHFFSSEKYIPSLTTLKSIVADSRLEKKTIVFTNGCFDILHSGHVNYLSAAKKLGDILIVGVNADESVKKLKGKNRPINPLLDRMQVLAGLSSIDYLISFSQDTPIHIIEAIHPNIYVKGGDYSRETLPETSVVEKYDGRVEIIPLIPEKSTTNIIQKINTTYTLSGGL